MILSSLIILLLAFWLIDSIIDRNHTKKKLKKIEDKVDVIIYLIEDLPKMRQDLFGLAKIIQEIKNDK